MQSHLQDLAKPAIATLLKVIDQTTNGNTFLLKVQTDTPLTASNYQDELRHFLRSPLFQEMIIEQDQQRELYNFIPGGVQQLIMTWKCSILLAIS
jgi:hypothetical protein